MLSTPNSPYDASLALEVAGNGGAMEKVEGLKPRSEVLCPWHSLCSILCVSTSIPGFQASSARFRLCSDSSEKNRDSITGISTFDLEDGVRSLQPTSCCFYPPVKKLAKPVNHDAPTSLRLSGN